MSLPSKDPLEPKVDKENSSNNIWHVMSFIVKLFTFFVNLEVLISINPACTAFIKDFWLPKVTLPEPI